MSGRGGSEKADPYGLLAHPFPWLEAAYSGGAIYQAKTQHLKYLWRGMTLLYPGVGTGEEAVEAALMGVRTTLLDSSSAMLRQAERHFRSRGVQDFEACHLRLEHFGGGGFDACAAHFFLNVFATDVLPNQIEAMNRLLRPGGYMFIADFSPLMGGPFLKWCQNAYWQIPQRIAHWITQDPLHPIYDYGPYLSGAGFQIVEIKDVPIFALGPKWYRFIAARKPN